VGLGADRIVLTSPAGLDWLRFTYWVLRSCCWELQRLTHLLRAYLELRLNYSSVTCLSILEGMSHGAVDH
jgi:hypothetical protein